MTRLLICDIDRTRHPKIFVGKLAAPDLDTNQVVDRLAELARNGLDGEIRVMLAELLPEARLGETVQAQAASTTGLGEQELLH